MSVNWESIEEAGIAAAIAAVDRAALHIAGRAKQLAPYRRTTEGQQSHVVTRFKTAREIEEQAPIRQRLGLSPDVRGSRTVRVRPPQTPVDDVLTRRGRYEAAGKRGGSHLRDLITYSPAKLEGRTIRARVVSPAPYSKYLEFGTRNTPAHPYMRPAEHEYRQEFRADVARSVAAAIRPRVSGRIEATIKMVAR